MNTTQLLLRPAALACLLAAAIYAASTPAQTVTGQLGSPGATTTIPGNQIPAPEPKFQGVIKENALQSKAWWAPTVVPPKQAPNILLIMTDDSGFGVPSTFGGVIPTPAMDRIAKAGLRYTQMHSTALCSPTRAALLTGRNHHSVGFGTISELPTGFPGYNSVIGTEHATIARILHDNGYRTAWFGKNHNTPDWQLSQAGPFNQWPTGMGFEYFYGFMGGDTSQWQPNLFRNTTQIYPFQDKPGWNLVTGMADDAIHHVKELNDINPSMPFFVYYAPGATHAPHHPTKEWVDKISKMHLFDGGWNKLRDTIFANQKRLGVIPQDAKLTPWPKDLLKEWDQLSAEDKKLFIRQADVFAAFTAYNDSEIGRVIQAVDDLGKLDNTLIIYINGDNGTSAEGTPVGTPNENLLFNGITLPVADQMNYYDAWGTDQTYPHMAVGWAWAFDTPYKWTKQIAAYFGGTRQGMVISWPNVIKDKGGIRNQFTHVIDIAPTLLEATGISAPEVVDGIRQKPIEGVSLAYTFAKENAEAPTRHTIQYFEMWGVRGLYKDGWMLSTVPINAPWNVAAAAMPDPANAFKWELFDLKKDWTQYNNIAAANPAKLKEMQDALGEELRKYQVFPLQTSVIMRHTAPRPSITAGRNTFTYSGGTVTGIPRVNAPNLLNTSFTITAELTIPSGGAEGMINTTGGRFGGYGFYLLKSKPIFVWNLLGMKNVRWEGPKLAPGKHTLEFDFKYDGLGFATLAFNSVSGLGRSATGVLKVDGKEVARQTMDHTISLVLPISESFDIGADTLTGVDEQDYQVPFNLTAHLGKLTIAIDRPTLTPEDMRKLKEAAANAADAK